MIIQYTKQNKNINIKGFTLVEALVAISILMVAIASPLSLAQKGISAAILSRDQMTASFLAQDGIEAVKNIRDQIALTQTSGDWLTPYLNGCIGLTNFCNIDTIGDLSIPNPPAVISAIKTGGTFDKLKITNNPDGSFLKYDLSSSPIVSKFSRTINIQQSAGNINEAVVTVKVSWTSPLGQQNITIKDFIYNYSDNL